MKKPILFLALLLFSSLAWSQENAFTLSGGYVFANLEEADTDANGFRINGLYELSPLDGNFSHGFSFGYIGTKAEHTVLSTNTTYKINSWPIYYAPRLSFGEKSLKGFIKGAIGMQFSGIKRTGVLSEGNDRDSGFYGGLGAGCTKTINDKMFVKLEYEWAYLSNSFYRDGFMNSLMLGVGMKF